MAIVNMKKMYLLGLRKEQDIILKSLQKSESADIINIVSDGEGEEKNKDNIQNTKSIKELTNLDSRLEQLNFGIRTLKPYIEERNILVEGKPKIDKKYIQKLLAQEIEIFQDIQSLYKLSERQSKLKAEETKIYNQLEQLKPWENLDIPLEKLGHTEKTYFTTATISRRIIKDFIEKLKQEQTLSQVEIINKKQDDVFILVVYHESHKEIVEEVFREFAVNINEFSGLEGKPKDIISEFKKKISDINSELKENKESVKKYIDRNMEFEILYDYYSVERDRKQALLKMGGTAKTFALEAWVPENRMEFVQKGISKLTDSVYINFEEPAEDENFPVLLSNHKLVEPFEAITDLFSLPNPHEIDPNVYMAPFYFVFFGMMLSDAGYGIVLSIATYIAMKKLHLSGLGKKMTELMFLSGISTVVWGAIFGGWFGDIFGIPPLWIDPLDDPMAVLTVSFIMGIIQIYTGIILKGYKNVRAGHTADAFMDQGLWLVFLTGLIMFAFPQLNNVAKYVSIFGVVGLILTQGRDKKNIIARLISGVLSLYDVTGYLSDVLSYSRLLALGISTGVIALVINTMARLIGGNFIGMIFMVLLLIVGHLFNILINVLGAYVHSSRLQYVEFFGEFYEGGGKAFKPLKVNTNFVDLEDI